MGFSFGRQSVAPRTGGAGTTAPEGTLSVTGDIALEVTAGDAAEVVLDTLDVANLGPGVVSNITLAVSYSGATGWLSVASGLTATGVSYTFTVDPSALSEGQEVATLTVTAGNATNSGITRTLTLSVGAASVPAPALRVSPPTLAVSIVDETALGTPVVAQAVNDGSGTMAEPTIGTITGAGAGYIEDVTVTGPAGGPYSITVTPIAVGGTPGGPYPALIPVSAAGATGSPATLTVNVTVTSAQTAEIGLDRILDDATYTIGGSNPPTQVVGFRNVGTGSFAGVTIQSATYSGNFGGWATPTLGASSLSVAINAAAITTEGSAYFTVVLADANAANTATYSVFLRTANAPVVPALNVAPGAIGFTVNNGTNPGNRTVTITNSNGSLAALGTLSVALSPPVAWCSVTGVVNGVATLAFTTDALANGAYATAVVVSASLAPNSPASVPVNVTVQAAPAGGSYPPGPALAALPQGWTYDQSVGHPVGSCFNDGGYSGAADGAMPAFGGTVYEVPGTYTIGQVLTLLGDGTIQDGDVVEIAAGTSLAGVQWPARSGWVEGTSGFVQIRTSGHASLPSYQGAAGPNKFTAANRATDAHAASMFSLTSSSNAISTLLLQRGASGYWFTGCRFYNSYTNANTNVSAIVASGGHVGTSLSQSQLSHRPSHIVFDRCLFRGAQSPTRAINAGATYCRIVQCSMQEAYKNDTEPQSILFLNGGDRTDVLGNSLNGWGECMYSGGGTPAIKDFSPSNIMAMWNYMWNDISHAGPPEYSDDNKNIVEFKTGWQAMFAFNKVDGACFKADQKFCFLAKATDQSEKDANGNPTQTILFPAHTHDIIFWCNDLSENIGKSFLQVSDIVSDAFSSATIGTERIEAAWNKHFWDTTVPAANAGGPRVPTNNDRLGLNFIRSQGNGVPGIHVYHNTFGAKQSFWTASANNNGVGWADIVVRDNILTEAPALGPIFGSGSGNNTTALNNNFGPGVWTCENNYILPGGAQWDATLQNFGNKYTASSSLAGSFVDPTNASNRDLTPIVPAGQPASYFNGQDGRPAGYDHTYMEEMLQGVTED